MRHLLYYIVLLAAVLLNACTSDVVNDREQPLPEGMGRLRIAVSTPETKRSLTRSVNAQPWEMPDHDWEKLQSVRIIICKAADNEIVEIIERTRAQLEVQSTSESNDSTYIVYKPITSEPLPAGNYTVFATANFHSSAISADAYDDGFAVGAKLNADATFRFTNGYSEKNIPMTGRLVDENGTPKQVTVASRQETDAGIITLWRAMGKLSFEFTNETSEPVQILGIEVEPINQASTTGSGIYLFSKDNLASITNLAAPNLSEAANDVTATWPLHETMQTQATLSSASFFSQAQLSWGTKLESTGYREAFDAAHTKLQIFKALEKVTHLDEGSAIVFAVKPNSGYTFTPKSLSFKATRGGTNGGHFDVVAIGNGTSTTLATGVRPMRYNGTGDENLTYISTYEYSLNHSATSGVFYVKIYLYDLDLGKDYAFSDVVITGDVKSIGVGKGESITLPQAALTDVGKVKYEPSTELTLNASGGTGNLFFYVNETDASFTTTENQLSIRLKIQRGSHATA